MHHEGLPSQRQPLPGSRSKSPVKMPPSQLLPDVLRHLSHRRASRLRCGAEGRPRAASAAQSSLQPRARSAGQCPNLIKPGLNSDGIQAPPHPTTDRGRAAGLQPDQQPRREFSSGPSSLRLQLPLSGAPKPAPHNLGHPVHPDTAPDPDRRGFWQHQGGRATASLLQAASLAASPERDQALGGAASGTGTMAGAGLSPSLPLPSAGLWC